MTDILTPRQERYWRDKEKENELSRNYYHNHKEITNKKYLCLCGGVFTRNNLYNHKKTNRHMDYVNGTGIFLRPLFNEQ